MGNATKTPLALKPQSQRQQTQQPANNAFIKLTVALLMGVSVLATISTSPLLAAEPDGPKAMISPEDALEYMLIDKISTTITGKTDYDQKIQDDLKTFYLENGRKPVWLTKDSISPRAQKALAEISNGYDFGLNVKDITTPKTAEITGSPEQRAEAELMISRAFITYAQRSKGGNLVPQKISRFLDNSPEYPEPLKVLNAVYKDDDPAKAIQSFHPKNPQFWALKKELDKIRAAKKAKKELVKIPDGSLIRPYDRHPQIALLRERLEVPVPIKNGAPLFPDDIYDSKLIQAVKNFQAANGLRSSGLVNRSTRSKLNHNKEANVESKILANMERWRWMPTEFGSTHIRVNIPEFLVRVTMDDQLVHQERVITGKPSQKTPSFSDEMETIVFNPYWNVPQSIIWNEMGGIAPAGYESQVVNGRVFIRQPPGPGNALGVVKFLFPNKHHVYLHDTPTKPLFNRDVRAFSHGCMRLRDPLKMAELVLKQKGISRKEINKRVSSRRNQRIDLEHKIPVHVTYFTMWSNGDGSFNHFNDIYGHDKRVSLALEGRPMRLEPKARINKTPLSSINKKKNYDSGPSFFNLFFN